MPEPTPTQSEPESQGRNTLGRADATLAYIRGLSRGRESDLKHRLREVTAQQEMARMQISEEQGQLLAFVARTLGATRALEVGVFTGYSALCVAEVLPADGLLVACDVSEEWTSIGRPFWEEAGVAERIDLRLAPAGETLAALIADGQAGTFDFAFVDADKSGYAGYFEQCLELLRPGGVIAFDNMLMGGDVVDPGPDDPDARHVRELGIALFGDERVEPVFVPVGDGVVFVRKR